MLSQIEQMWYVLWFRTGAKGDSRKVYNDLVERYSEPHRSYHILDHIKQCLMEFGQIFHLARDSNAVEWAIWYHDAIYDPKAKDNEERSADLSAKVIRMALLPEDFEESVFNLIIASKHFDNPKEPDAKLFVDIDLSILGQDWEKFAEYERQIKKEYDWMSEDAFIKGRSEILKRFLSRSSIYSTPFFMEKYEIKARENLRKSLLYLSG